MALNDYADRTLDRTERPERPIPSGRVRPGQALALAACLTGAGLALAAAAGGRPALRVAAPLAATVWTYDLAAKNTPAGPAVMATARTLDVLLGAGRDWRPATVPALAIGLHTTGVTLLSRGEVHGTRRATPRAALATTTAAALTTAWPQGSAPAPAGGLLPAASAAASAAAYAATVGRAQLAAARTPDAPTVRHATGTGIRGIIPLQAGLLARANAPALAAALLSLGPLARLASKVVSPT
jgi:4-hydroxybenzoate polyprenyltransferase